MNQNAKRSYLHILETDELTSHPFNEPVRLEYVSVFTQLHCHLWIAQTRHLTVSHLNSRLTELTHGTICMRLEKNKPNLVGQLIFF